jgi:hypothetical protein
VQQVQGALWSGHLSLERQVGLNKLDSLFLSRDLKRLLSKNAVDGIANQLSGLSLK